MHWFIKNVYLLQVLRIIPFEGFSIHTQIEIILAFKEPKKAVKDDINLRAVP